MLNEICGDLKVGDQIKWTNKYDPKFQRQDRVMYSYYEHRNVQITTGDILLCCDCNTYSWLDVRDKKIYSSFWVDDYFKARL
jgi:hypothetical protein